MLNIKSVILKARDLPRYHDGTTARPLRPLPFVPQIPSGRHSSKHPYEATGVKRMSDIIVEEVPLDTEIAPLSQSKQTVNLAPSSTQVTPSPFHNTATATQNNLHVYERLQGCIDSPLVSRKRENNLINDAKIQETGDVLKVPPQMRSRANTSLIRHLDRMGA